MVIPGKVSIASRLISSFTFTMGTLVGSDSGRLGGDKGSLLSFAAMVIYKAVVNENRMKPTLNTKHLTTRRFRMTASSGARDSRDTDDSTGDA